MSITCVTHVWTTTLIMRCTNEKNCIMRVFHADRTPRVFPFFNVFLRFRRDFWEGPLWSTGATPKWRCSEPIRRYRPISSILRHVRSCSKVVPKKSKSCCLPRSPKQNLMAEQGNDRKPPPPPPLPLPPIGFGARSSEPSRCLRTRRESEPPHFELLDRQLLRQIGRAHV